MNNKPPVKLSIIIPVYNEKNTISAVLEKVKNIDIPKEIIVVDNCSTDGTKELLKQIKGIDQLILQPTNLGKGNSIRTAIPHVKGEFTIIQDADLEYNPDSFYSLLNEAETGAFDVVYGSRLRGGVIRTRYVSYYFGVQVLTFLINKLFNANLTDAATTYKLIRTHVLKSLNLRCYGFDLDFELTNQILKKGIKIAEITIPYTPRSFKDGKKIRAWDGLKALKIIFKNFLFD
ncbi:MAG: glycosyltransferase family 2 protein [Elusimicrobia bacterium]|nr:glycosyltransferase family 2 protein [Elusimicrobiota bacterium]